MENTGKTNLDFVRILVKFLLLRIIENNKIDAYFRSGQVK